MNFSKAHASTRKSNLRNKDGMATLLIGQPTIIDNQINLIFNSELW